MSFGKERQDILRAILEGMPDDEDADAPSLGHLIRRSAEPGEIVGAQGVARTPKKTASPARSKHKSTHYLSGEILTELNEAREKLRGLVLEQHPNVRISKSQIVDQALRMILGEFGKKGEKSPLFKEILKKSVKKTRNG